MKRVVCAVMRDELGRYLAAQRAAGPLAGKWEFPGGKIEEGETPQQACERELQEELGIQVAAGEVVLAHSIEIAEKVFELLFIEADWKGGKMIPAEHLALRWVRSEDLRALDWLEGDLPMVERIQQES